MSRSMSRKYMRQYRSLPFFNQLPHRSQELLRRMGTELIVLPGGVVASSDDGGRQCALLLSGTFTWSEPDPSGQLEPIRCLGAGDFLDEEALSWACATEEGPGAFSVQASTEARVLVFHRLEFKELVRQAPSVASVAAVRTAAHMAAWQPRTGRVASAAPAVEEAPSRAGRTIDAVWASA